MSSSLLPSSLRLPLAAALVLVLGVTGCGRQAAPGAPRAAEVTVVTLAPTRVELTRELSGRTAASVIAEVRPQVGGIVRARLFTEGGDVEAGQVLYELDDATYQAEHNSAKAELARAQSAHELARLNADRMAALAQANAISRQENESTIAVLRQSEAVVNAAQAAADRTEVTLGYCRIKSPIQGRIGKSTVTQGALVTANQAAALAVVQQLDPIYIDVAQSSREWLDLRQEMDAGALKHAELPVTILLEDGSRYPQPGRLEFSGASVDPTTGSIAYRATVPNPGHLLLPGMYVRAVVGTAVREKAILVPQPGIARDPRGNASALVVGPSGLAEVRPVQVSRTVGDKWLVESGLAAGDKVIVEGLQKIRPGMPVHAVEAGAAPAARN